MDGSDRARTLRGGNDVGAAESGWVVGRGRLHVFRRWGEHAVHQWNRVRRLFSRGLELWGARVLLRFVWRARGRAGSGGRAHVGVSLPSRFSNSVYKIAAGDNR